MSFTTLNTFNSNLWKGGKVKPTLYGLSVQTNDLSVNTITVNYRYSGVSYVTMDIIGSSGYISSQPRYNVISSPVTNIITGLNPNTYYNFVLVPYDRNDIRGSSYYFSGFSGGVSSFTSSTNAITSSSTPVNYSNLVKPFCTLSKINSLTNTYNTTTNFNTNSMTFNMSCTDMSYVKITLNGIDTNISKPAGSGSIINLSNTQSLNLPFVRTTLTTAYTYNYTLNIYNNAGIGNPVPSTVSYTRPSLIASTTGGGVIDICNNYYVINFNTSGTITFNTNISNNYIGNVLLVGKGGAGGSKSNSRGGGGGGGAFVNINYSFNLLNEYNIFVSTIAGGNTTLSNNNIVIQNAIGGGAGGKGATSGANGGAGGAGGSGGGGAGGGARLSNYTYGLGGAGGLALNNDGSVAVNNLYGYTALSGNDGASNAGNARGGAGAGGTSGSGSNPYNESVGGRGRIWPINGVAYGAGGTSSDNSSPGGPPVFMIAFLA